MLPPEAAIAASIASPFAVIQVVLPPSLYQQTAAQPLTALAEQAHQRPRVRRSGGLRRHPRKSPPPPEQHQLSHGIFQLADITGAKEQLLECFGGGRTQCHVRGLSSSSTCRAQNSFSNITSSSLSLTGGIQAAPHEADGKDPHAVALTPSRGFKEGSRFVEAIIQTSAAALRADLMSRYVLRINRSSVNCASKLSEHFLQKQRAPAALSYKPFALRGTKQSLLSHCQLSTPELSTAKGRVHEQG